MRYSPDKILRLRSLQQGQSSNQGVTYFPQKCPYQVSTSYTLWMPRYSPEKILKSQGQYSKDKGQGHTMKMHTYTPQQMSLPYLLVTIYIMHP